MSMSDQSGLAAFFESMRPDMEHADRVRAALPKPIAAVFFSRDGKALDITLDTNANDYSDWIKGEGADIGLKRDRDTEKVVGAHLPLYAKTLMIGGDDMPTLLVDIATGKVTQWPEREAPLTPAPPAKRLEDRDRTFPYEAACSGLRYENPASCGDVAAIWLDGKRWEVLDRSALTAAQARIAELEGERDVCKQQIYRVRDVLSFSDGNNGDKIERIKKIVPGLLQGEPEIDGPTFLQQQLQAKLAGLADLADQWAAASHTPMGEAYLVTKTQMANELKQAIAADLVADAVAERCEECDGEGVLSHSNRDCPTCGGKGTLT
jgi:hypothetical protein